MWQAARALTVVLLVGCGVDDGDTDDASPSLTGTGTGAATGTGSGTGGGTGTGATAGTGSGASTGTGSATGTGGTTGTGTGSVTGTGTGAVTGTGTGTSDPCAVQALEFELGTGEDVYVPLAEDDDLAVIYGAQGGWHVETAGRVHTPGDAVQVEGSVVRISDTLQIAGDAQPPIFLALADYDPETCTGDFFGARLFINDYVPPTDPLQFYCSLDGEPLQLTVTVSDLVYAYASTETVRVIGRLNPDGRVECGLP